MDKLGYIQIRIKGFKGNIELIPENYDIKELISIQQNVEDLLYPTSKVNRPIISYQIEKGSVKHIFKTSIQYIIGFNALIGQIGLSQNIDFLDGNTAKAFESIQEIAKNKDYFFEINTSIDEGNRIEIDKNSNYYRSEVFWADAEFYFYGKITNVGGKGKANIHISTEELGTIRVQTPKKFLKG